MWEPETTQHNNKTIRLLEVSDSITGYFFTNKT